VLIRNEEWIVRSVDQCDLGGHELECIGVSETVRHRDAIFLTEIDEVAVLDPRQTELVADSSPRYIASLLYLEAKLRQTVPTDGAISVGHLGAMDALPFQLEPTRRVLEQLRPRFLIADSVGLGKTLEAGVLVSELIRRGRGRRILVVTTKSMMLQFQKELWTRFSIPLTRLDSAGIQRLKRHLPSNHNPFHYYDKTIISVDTLKKDDQYRTNLEKAWWDIIVIDEAHNVSEKSQGIHRQRNKVANLLAQRSDALILLTATPHSGDKDSFASLMRMLDPTALPSKAEYTKEDVEHLFVRPGRDQAAFSGSEGVPVPGGGESGGGEGVCTARGAEAHDRRSAARWRRDAVPHAAREGAAVVARGLRGDGSGENREAAQEGSSASGSRAAPGAA
jgi:hypothetical protein